jgi:uncharacterized protein YndB with AHSA1/START domain
MDVERTVGTESVALARTYSTTVEDLWDACTTAERIARWFAPVSGDLRLGGKYAIEGNAHGTIEACDPPNGFRVSWEYGDTVSYVELRLTAVGREQTRFELAHSGLGGSRWDEFGPGAVGLGWDLTVFGLGLHLESGADSDPSWMVSEEGKEFCARSSEQWRDAHVAAGADPEVAQASADRTKAAYTG